MSCTGFLTGSCGVTINGAAYPLIRSRDNYAYSSVNTLL